MSKKRLKRDDRSFHGRPRRDRKRDVRVPSKKPTKG